MATKYVLVMIRHGESEYNKENRFCGWFDADLSQQGMDEAIHTGNIWRRSYDIRPPPLDLKDARSSSNENKYFIYNKAVVPLHEYLKDTVKRVLPYWHDVIVPAMMVKQPHY